MIRRSAFAALLVPGLVVPGLLLAPSLAAPAAAEVCAVDRSPGATVLLPYFEVDLTRGASGETTLVELANALPRAVLARVTLWTDLGVPTYSFDAYLTGYDLQAFNLRDLFLGLGPATGPGISPSGALSLPGTPLEGCGDEVPVELPVAHLQAAHTGAPVAAFGNLCGGRAFGDGRARGYLTADVVGGCGGPAFPSDPGYFGPGGIARDDNALWGTYFYVDPLENYAQAENLVRLEADPEAFGEGDLTFYGRYHGHSGVDAREPLPSAWAARSLSVAAFGAGTEWVVWRETPGPPVPFVCGTAPDWYPLPLAQLVGFDEEENPLDLRELVFVVAPEVVPGAAQRGFDFPVAADAGWVYADLAVSAVEPAQAYVAPVIGAEGRYSVGTAATALSAPCGPSGCELGDEHPAGRICIDSADGDGVIDAGEAARVEVRPAGCFDSCGLVQQAACSVRATAGGRLETASRFCVQQPPPGCIGPPVCLEVVTGCATPPLAPGEHTLRAGDLELIFTVPAAVPPGGLCAGSVF